MRRPYGLALRDPVQVFFRKRADPLPAVFLLAFRELGNDGVRLRFQLHIPGFPVMHGCGGKPVAEEMPPQLAGGKFPARMDAFGYVGGRIPSGLQVIIQQQETVFQMHHVAPVIRFPCQQHRVGQPGAASVKLL